MATLDIRQHQLLLEAIEHHKNGRLQNAEAAYKRLLAIDPTVGDAWANLAVALHPQRKFDEAIRSLERAAELLPARIDLLDLLGTWYLQHGDPHRAIATHRKAIALNPNNAPSHANLGLALAKKQGGMDDAIAACRTAVELAPHEAVAHRILAIVLEQAKRYSEAADAFEASRAIDPSIPDSYGGRALCLEALDRLDETVAVLRDGIAHCPNEPRLYANLSGVLRKKTCYVDALQAADQALKLAPASSDAHGHRSLALLSLGDYENGFTEYEWRWRCDDFTTRPRDFNRPLWDGSDPRGRTILVHAEQGLGDSLQFARYLPLLADRGAKVYFECNHALRKLMSRVRGVNRVIVAGTGLPDFDLHAPLLSLPRAFHSTMQTIPRDVPYLFADEARKVAWNERFKSLSNARLKVGLIWAGNAKPDAKRTISADALTSLAGLPDVQFFSLQKHEADTYQPPPAELKPIDVANELTDFDETAAAMGALDLIVTIDTGPAHLAGGLACNTLLMLPWSADWRWLAGDSVSHWYPTTQMFRQTIENDWTDVLQRVRAKIENAVTK